MVNDVLIDESPGKPGFLESTDKDALQFYRCLLCRRIVNIWDLRKYKGCGYCGHARISPANLTLWEKIFQIVKHPKVWKWKQQKNRM